MDTTMILIIIGAILIIMAIIGYIAEKKGLVNKKEKKEDKVSEITLPTDNTWSSEAKPKDEKEELVYTVPSMDDWSTIPTDDLVVNKVGNDDVSKEAEDMFSERKTDDLEIPGENVLKNIEKDTNSDTEVLSGIKSVSTAGNIQTEPEPLEVSVEGSTPLVESAPLEDAKRVQTIEEVATSDPVETLDQPENINKDYNFDFANQVSNENGSSNLNNHANQEEPEPLESLSVEEKLQVAEPKIETLEDTSNQSSVWN